MSAVKACRITCFLMVLCVYVCGAASAVTVLVDGKPLHTSPRAVIRRGRIYLPPDAFRRIGLWVDTREAPSHVVVAWPNSDAFFDFSPGHVWIEPAEKGGPREYLPGRPFVRGGKLMLPLRAVIDGDNFGLEWEPRTQTARIHRDPRWLKWRLGRDEELRKGSLGRYVTPI
jgi:hypothetical protein